MKYILRQVFNMYINFFQKAYLQVKLTSHSMLILLFPEISVVQIVDLSTTPIQSQRSGNETYTLN